MASIPVVSSFGWKLQGDNELEPSKIFVHITDYPGSVLWIWIGDSSATMPNLSLALKSRGGASTLQKEVNSTTGN